MKKQVALLLALLMVLACSCAMAAGDLKITQDNCYLVEDGEDFSYITVFAKVENVGDAPVVIGASSVIYYAEDGSVLVEDSWMNFGKEVLEPGEYTYASEICYTDYDDGQDMTLAYDYVVTVAPSDFLEAEDMDPIYPFEATAEFVEAVKAEDWWDDIPAFMQGIVTNPYEDAVFASTYVQMTLLDQDGGIIYSDEFFENMDFALMPGSSFAIRLEVPEAILEIAAEAGRVPTTVDIVAYQW